MAEGRMFKHPLSDFAIKQTHMHGKVYLRLYPFWSRHYLNRDALHACLDEHGRQETLDRHLRHKMTGISGATQRTL